MKLDFRIDWGYQYLYSRRHYHPFYLWDGKLTCDNGTILETYKLNYPVVWYGPGHTAIETKLDKPEWQDKTRRGLCGVRFVAEVTDDTVFHLQTASACFDFKASDVAKDGRLILNVGPKYLNCHIIVTKTGYFWFQPAKKPGQQLWEADDLNLPVHDWARMHMAWLAPGAEVTFEAVIPENTEHDYFENLLHLVAMIAKQYAPGHEGENVAHDFIPCRLLCDGKEIASFTKYYRQHDGYMQIQEDDWVRFQASPGKHTLTLCNDHDKYFLLLNRLILQQSYRDHLQLSLPDWALVNEPLIGRIFAVKADETEVCWPGGSAKVALVPGWNEFRFSLTAPATDVVVKTKGSEGRISAVYDLPEETPKVTVGYDMTVVPHDHNGFMDWILDYTWRTRLGNLAVFRNFERINQDSYEVAPLDPQLLTDWGNFCREHNITVEAATDFFDGSLSKAAGEAMHSAGRHEWPGAVYAFDPQEGWSSNDMKEAMENYLRHLKIEVDKAHHGTKRCAFGDASGGHRYCYMAGADFMRTETMVPHTQHLCSQARPAAEVFSDGEWGVHIAIQHPVQPYFYNHLGMYFLSLFQPWMMGASMIYEEDSLFVLFKEERQSWDDALTKGKRDMTRKFFRFVKTHPRSGHNRRNIAFLEGRYAAPFNGFICDVEQTPDYSVWGKFGNNDPMWGHKQPEKCRQVLDVLMPGASTLPLRQRFDRRRFYFSGTPYGDFDEIPVEAKADYFDRYKLIVNLGWNTMLDEDYQKLLHFVRNGGTLFTGIPQFSTHVRRDFLRDMQDLALWHDGDFRELCGARILGPSDAIFCGQWNGLGRESFPEPQLSAIPSKSAEEDGPCRLAEVELSGAEVVAWDADTCKPLMLRYQCGKGQVYLLTAWAYPGHEKLQQFSASWLAKLADAHKGDLFVDDASRDVFWTRWEEDNGVRRLLLLNTDWSAPNAKPVTVHAPGLTFETAVQEQVPLMLTILPFAALEPDAQVHTEILEVSADQATLKFHGTGTARLKIYHQGGSLETRELVFQETSTTLTIRK